MVRQLRYVKEQFAKHSHARKAGAPLTGAQKGASGTPPLFKASGLMGKVLRVPKVTYRTAGVSDTDSPRSRLVGDALWRKISNRAPRTDARMSLQERAQKLVDKYGSQRAAAKAAGLNRRSFDRALKGENVSGKSAEKITARDRKDTIKPTNAAKLKKSMTGVPTDKKTKSVSPGNTFAIYLTIVISTKPEERWVYPGRDGANAGLFNDLEDLVGQGPEAFQDRVQTMMDNYVAGEVTDIHYINW